MRDRIRLADDALFAVSTYQEGEPLIWTHPLAVAMRALTKAHHGRLPAYPKEQWQLLREHRRREYADNLGRWLAEKVGGEIVPYAAEAGVGDGAPEPEHHCWGNEVEGVEEPAESGDRLDDERDRSAGGE